MLHDVRMRRAAGGMLPAHEAWRPMLLSMILGAHERIQTLEQRIACFNNTFCLWVETFMSSTNGWILDAHLCSAQLEMLVWIVTEEGSVVSVREPWHPTLHVAGSTSDPEHLVEWLSQPEIWIRYGLQRYAFERKRPELGSFDTEHMLALTLESCATLRSR